MFKMLMMAAACVLGCAAWTMDAGAAASEHGSLKGRTKQGRAIRLVLRPDSIEIKRFAIELRCGDGSYLIDDESGFMPTALRRGGRLRDHQVGDTDEVWIRGRLRGRILGGAIRVHDRFGRTRCDSRWVRFHARRGG